MDTNFNLVEATITDVEEIANQIAGIAFETVQKHLDVDTVKKAVTRVLQRPELGVYYVVRD